MVTKANKAKTKAKNNDKTIRYSIWELWSKDLSSGAIAEQLKIDAITVLKAVKLFERAKRMSEKESKNDFFIPKQVEVEKTLFEKISEKHSHSNQFVLISTDYRVHHAYYNMINRKNIDIPM